MLATSAATGAGLDELAAAIARRVPMEDDGTADGPCGELPATHRIYRPGRGRRDQGGAHGIRAPSRCAGSGPSA